MGGREGVGHGEVGSPRQHEVAAGALALGVAHHDIVGRAVVGDGRRQEDDGVVARSADGIGSGSRQKVVITEERHAGGHLDGAATGEQ